MNFEQRQQVRDMFIGINHEGIASKVLAPELYIPDAEVAMSRLVASEATMSYADESVMQQIIGSLGGSEVAMGTHESAFFGGTLLALTVSDILAFEKLGDSMRYRELWLSKKNMFFASEITDGPMVDIYTTALNTHSLDTEVAYDDAIEIIAPFLVESEEASELLYAGFAHALVSAKSCIAELVQQTIDSESEDAEWDFDQFLKENDLTGSLQDVQRSYFEHCVELGITDPYHIGASEEQIRQLLAMTMNDYEHTVAEMRRIEIEGPLFITVTDSTEFDNGGEEDVIVLEAGTKIVGTPGLMSLSLVPVDELYIGCDNHMGLNLNYAPSFVFTDATLNHSNGEIESFAPEQYVYVGFSVPLAKYRSIPK